MKLPVYKPLRELFAQELHHSDLEAFLYTYKRKSPYTSKETLHYLQHFTPYDYSLIPDTTIVDYYQEGTIKTYHKAELYEYIRTLIDSNSFQQRLEQHLWHYFLTQGQKLQ